MAVTGIVRYFRPGLRPGGFSKDIEKRAPGSSKATMMDEKKRG
jgi:hypothetical protein